MSNSTIIPHTNDTKDSEKDKESERDSNGRVTIRVNNTELSVRRGQHSVLELKQLAGVPAAWQLDRSVDGSIEPLADDAKVHIRGGEIFVAYPGKGASS